MIDGLRNIAVIGASGGIGAAFVQALGQRCPHAALHAFSRSGTGPPGSTGLAGRIDLTDEASIEAAAGRAAEQGPVDAVIVASGVLHEDGRLPERSLRDVSADWMLRSYAVNCLGPALVLKHFVPLLARDRPALVAALSARVGSVSDNRLGGWYGYRAAKAALNMIIRNAAIEAARKYPKAVIVGLHPGTVDSGLSKPFQASVPDGRLFTPGRSVEQLLDVLDRLAPENSGRCFAYDGSEVAP